MSQDGASLRKHGFARLEPSAMPSPAPPAFAMVRSYRGHPAAARGDFAPVEYPYGAAIVFTRTFKVS